MFLTWNLRKGRWKPSWFVLFFWGWVFQPHYSIDCQSPIRLTTRAWVGFFLEDGGVDAQERLSLSLVAGWRFSHQSMRISSDPQKFRPNVGIFASVPRKFAPKFQLPFLGVLLHNFTFWVVPLGTRFHISTIGDWGCLTNQPSAAETNCWWGKWWVDNYQKKGRSVFRCVTIALSE